MSNGPSRSEHAASEGSEKDEAASAEEIKATKSKDRQKNARTSKQSKALKGRQNFVRIDRKVR